MVTTEIGCRLGVGWVPKLPFIQELRNFQVRKGDRKEQKQHYPLVAAKQYGNKVWNSKRNRLGVSLHSCCKENCMRPEGHQHWGDELESLYYMWPGSHHTARTRQEGPESSNKTWQNERHRFVSGPRYVVPGKMVSHVTCAQCIQHTKTQQSLW